MYFSSTPSIPSPYITPTTIQTSTTVVMPEYSLHRFIIHSFSPLLPSFTISCQARPACLLCFSLHPSPDNPPGYPLWFHQKQHHPHLGSLSKSPHPSVTPNRRDLHLKTKSKRDDKIKIHMHFSFVTALGSGCRCTDDLAASHLAAPAARSAQRGCRSRYRLPRFFCYVSR